MKKIFRIILTVLFVFAISMPSFAAKTNSKSKAEEKFDRVVAEVVSLDTAAKTMVVKREENGESMTVAISAKAASQLHVGDRVRIKLKAGTNKSAGVRVLGAKPGAEAVAPEPGAKPDVKGEAQTESKPEAK